MLHAPQCAGSPARLAQPLPQSSKPVSQPTDAHLPAAQLAIEPSIAQALPQVPQLLNVRSEVSQPFDEMSSQSLKPASHPVSAAPCTQLASESGAHPWSIRQGPPVALGSQRACVT